MGSSRNTPSARAWGADNIARGIPPGVVWGMAAIMTFMCVYYVLFGVFSAIALSVNVLMLIAVLSILAGHAPRCQASPPWRWPWAWRSTQRADQRTHPRELRAGVAPQAAIATGYERAWATILDSNASPHADRGPGAAGLRLWEPVRGSAVVTFHRHPDQRVLGRVLLARPGQPLVWPQEETQERGHRPECGSQRTRASCAPWLAVVTRRKNRRFFRIKDIPFMEYALVLNAVSYHLRPGGVLPGHARPAPVGGVLAAPPSWRWPTRRPPTSGKVRDKVAALELSRRGGAELAPRAT